MSKAEEFIYIDGIKIDKHTAKASHELLDRCGLALEAINLIDSGSVLTGKTVYMLQKLLTETIKKANNE